MPYVIGKPTGICLFCQQHLTLTKDGKFRKHRRSHSKLDKPCKGSGQIPSEQVVDP